MINTVSMSSTDNVSSNNVTNSVNNSAKYCERRFNSGELNKKDLFLKALFNIIPETNIKRSDQYTTTLLQIETTIKSDNVPHEMIVRITKIGGKVAFCNETLWVHYRIPVAFPLYFTGTLYVLYSLCSLYLLAYHQDILLSWIHFLPV